MESESVLQLEHYMAQSFDWVESNGVVILRMEPSVCFIKAVVTIALI